MLCSHHFWFNCYCSLRLKHLSFCSIYLEFLLLMITLFSVIKKHLCSRLDTQSYKVLDMLNQPHAFIQEKFCVNYIITLPSNFFLLPCCTNQCCQSKEFSIFCTKLDIAPKARPLNVPVNASLDFYCLRTAPSASRKFWTSAAMPTSTRRCSHPWSFLHSSA